VLAGMFNFYRYCIPTGMPFGKERKCVFYFVRVPYLLKLC